MNSRKAAKMKKRENGRQAVEDAATTERDSKATAAQRFGGPKLARGCVVKGLHEENLGVGLNRISISPLPRFGGLGEARGGTSRAAKASPVANRVCGHRRVPCNAARVGGAVTKLGCRLKADPRHPEPSW